VLCAKVASVSSGESLLTCAFTLQLNPPRKSAAPAFATNLGLLEPKKAVPDPFASAGVDIISVSERPYQHNSKVSLMKSLIGHISPFVLALAVF